MFGQFVIMVLALVGAVYSLFNDFTPGIVFGLVIAVVALFRLVVRFAKATGSSPNV